MFFIEADTMDEVQHKVITSIINHGRRVRPRGMWVQELTAFGFRLNNPRARITYSPARKFNLMFAIGELLWYLRGSDELSIISFYNKRYPNFSDDGITLYGAYGKRLFTDTMTDFIQWNRVYQLLREDPDSRQAVLHLHMPKDLNIQSRDIPCTCYIQFLIRDHKLECIVNMRSNDIIWGTAYDVFSFTMMHELMARQLGIELGSYTHFAGSMHLYDNHRELANSILTEPPYQAHEMPSMPDDPWKGLSQLLVTEEQLRLKSHVTDFPEEAYWRDLAFVLQGHVGWREKDDHKLAEVIKKIPHEYKVLMPVITSVNK